MSLLDRAVSLAIPFVPKPIVRRFSRRYIAGERVEDAFRVARHLVGEGAMATLDILGEFITGREEAEKNTLAYQDLIRRIAEEKLPETNVSVKLTSLGLLLDGSLCRENTRKLVKTASESDNFLRIDMEDSQCTSPTLDVYRAVRDEVPRNVGVALQAYLRRTLDDIDRLTEKPTNVRLCKGIYVEPRTIAFKDREIVRLAFTAALERLLERGAYVGIATHDEQLVFEAHRLIRRHGLEREQYEFQMLLGVDEELRRIILDAGHRLRVYIPFGDHWYSYSVRRLRENPQIAGYAFKSALGLR